MTEPKEEKTMKHTYTMPQADLLSLCKEDIICSSNENDLDVGSLFLGAEVTEKG